MVTYRRRRWLATIPVMFVVLGAHARAAAQDPSLPAAPTSDQKTVAPEDEAGGRLVVSSETVVVVADPDLPSQDASIATKTDTPLINTPRSVSVTERQTLDDRLAVNIADAHDYTVGV